MGNNLVSIDLGSRNIYLVTGRYNKNGLLEVSQTVQKQIPDGVYKDGRIEDFNILSSTIRNILAENKIRNKQAVLTIQSTSVITREITLPTVKHAELENIVKFEIEQYLPIVSSEYIIEYTLIEEIQEDNIRKSKIQVAAMPKIMVDNYLNLVKECGLKPAALDIHSNVVSKLFSKPLIVNYDNYTLDKTFAFIDFGYTNINVHIISKGKLIFSRIVTLGAKELDSEISIEMNMALEQAEQKKIKDADLDYGDADETLNDIIRTRIDSWMSEIQKIFQYFISRSTGNRIDSIYIYGGSSKIKGLPRYTEQVLNLKTSRIDSLSIVKPAKNTPEFSHCEFINALGGLIRYE